MDPKLLEQWVRDQQRFDMTLALLPLVFGLLFGIGMLVVSQL